LRGDNLPEHHLRDFLIFATSVGRVDEPDGFDAVAAGQLLDEFAGDGASLVLVLNIDDKDRYSFGENESLRKAWI